MSVLCAWLATLAPTTSRAEAESPVKAAALAAAERAYQEIDYDAVYEAAKRGLAAGRASVAETARFNVLAGIAAASLGREEEARSHFLVALAVQPSLDLGKELSPRIRGPYLEALGFWRARQDRLELEVKIEPTTHRLKFRVADPTNLSAKVVFFVRPHGKTEFFERAVDATPRGFWQLENHIASNGFEYFAELVDKRRNRLMTIGSEDDPLVVRERPLNGEGTNETSSTSSRSSVKPERSWLLPIATLTAGAAFAGAGIYFSVHREQAAERWNGSACEQPGMSRIQQCGDVDAERARMQWLAVGAYTGATALTLVGTTMLLWPSRSDASKTATFPSCGMGLASIRCGGAF